MKQLNQAPVALTYEEELKALKAKWADKKKEAKKQERADKKSALKETAKVEARKALEIVKAIDNTFTTELAPVVKRLEMFINDEKYTRSKGGNE